MPIIHIALPPIFQMIQKLDNITNGLQLWRGEGQALEYPSVSSRALARVVHERMLKHV